VDECSQNLFLGEVDLRTKNIHLDYGCDPPSDLDPGISSLLIAIRKIVLHYYSLLGVSTIMPMILVISMISILYTSLIFLIKTYSLNKV